MQQTADFTSEEYWVLYQLKMLAEPWWPANIRISQTFMGDCMFPCITLLLLLLRVYCLMNWILRWCWSFLSEVFAQSPYTVTVPSNWGWNLSTLQGKCSNLAAMFHSLSVWNNPSQKILTLKPFHSYFKKYCLTFSSWVPVFVDDEQRLAVMSIGFLLASRNDAVIWRGPKKNGEALVSVPLLYCILCSLFI